MMSHNIKLLNYDDFTKLLYCINSQPWKGVKLVLKSSVALIYEWDPKVVIYSILIKPLLIKTGDNKYSQDRHHNISS